MTSTKKTLVAALALLGFSGFAGASGLYISNASDIRQINGYDAPPVVGPDFTHGTLGTLKTDVAGSATFTYLGDESGYDNHFRYMILGPDLYLREDGAAQANAIGDSVTTALAPGVLSFKFADSNGGYAVNGGWVTRNTSFAMLYTLGQDQVKTYAQDISIGGVMQHFDYILGFNDSYRGDADFDDYVVGVRFTPSAVPLPAAGWLFGSALLGFMAMSNRRRV